MELSVFLQKIYAQPRSKAAQAGQAVLEYILVLVITVAIILGVMYQFNDAFKQFLDNYFGDYIACLLESGELPSLGGSGPNQSQCRSPLQDFAVSAGNSLYNGGSGSSGSGGNAENGQNGNNSNAENNRSSSSSGGGRSNLRRPTVTGSGATPNAEGTGQNRLRRNRVKINNQNQNANSDGTNFDEKDASIGGRRGRRVTRRKRIIYIGDEYLSEEEKKKRALRGQASRKKKKSKTDSGDLRKPALTFDKKKAGRTVAEEEESGFSFGFFIKFLLIAGIIIAIVIFLGGQAVQIKKSWQKSD